MVLRAWCENEGWGLGWGIIVGVESFLDSCTQLIVHVINQPTRFPIPYPSPVPCPVGGWVLELCGSYVSKISQPRLWFNRLSTPNVQNEFFPFLCRGSTQLREYDQGFPPYNSINRNNKRWKQFLLIVTVLTVVLFLGSFPPIQERWHWIIIVGIHISIAKVDVNDGFSLLIS